MANGSIQVVGAVNKPANGTPAAETDSPKSGAATGLCAQLRGTGPIAAADGDVHNLYRRSNEPQTSFAT